MLKKWKWEKLEPDFDIGQAVWVVKSPIDITAKSYVEKGFVFRIHIEVTCNSADYIWWLQDDDKRPIGQYRFDNIYRTKKEAAKACLIRNKEWALRKLEGEVHEAKVSLAGFKKYSKGALEETIKELEELVKSKTKELKALKESANEKS